MTFDQPLVALSKANVVRTRRSADKKRIGAGTLDPLEILDRPPDHWRNARILELLLAMHRVGRSRSDNWLKMANVPASAKLHQLTQAQRYEIAGFVMYGQHSSWNGRKNRNGPRR